jgi:hypothetical protein
MQIQKLYCPECDYLPFTALVNFERELMKINPTR